LKPGARSRGSPALTIGRLARAAGVPTSTIRYYERLGLLRPTQRSRTNYRACDEAALERLRFIRIAKQTGFTLDDVSALLDLRARRSEPCAEVQHMLERRLADVEQRLRELERVRAVLEESLAGCRAWEHEGRCEVMDRLTTR
jgi:MerR family mercuric resistance operon transcriptional regulator